MINNTKYEIKEIGQAVNKAWQEKEILYFADDYLQIGEPFLECPSVNSSLYRKENEFALMAYKLYAYKYVRSTKRTAEISEEKDITNKLIAYYKSYGMEVLEVKHELITDTYELIVAEKFIGKHYKVYIRDVNVYLEKKDLKEIIGE